MDELSEFNRRRWNDLAAKGVQYAQLWLDLDADEARRRVDPLGILGDPAGRDVLLLAGAGGQQSAAFGILGARVTVFDLSDEMLACDRRAAEHYGHEVRCIRGDARDISALVDEAFDIVWQAHCLTFIPDIEAMYDGVVRVIRPGGTYHLSAWNPLAHGADDRWTGQGYLLQPGYREGAELALPDDTWLIETPEGGRIRLPGPKEFRHTLTAICNGLIGRGFCLLDLREEPFGDPDAPPGSWEHFCSVAPPYLTIWATWRPDILGGGSG